MTDSSDSSGIVGLLGLHLFICDDQREALLEKCINDAARLVGHHIAEPRTDQRTLEEILEQRHEVAYANEEAGAVRFDVYKNTRRCASPSTALLHRSLSLQYSCKSHLPVGNGRGHQRTSRLTTCGHGPGMSPRFHGGCASPATNSRSWTPTRTVSAPETSSRVPTAPLVARSPGLGLTGWGFGGGRTGLVSVRHMATVFAVVSDPGEQQWMTIEFMDGSKLHYMSKTREALIACVLDACEVAGNHSGK